MNTQNRPNIVLIVADSVRADRLSCYGHTRETTPSVDALAQEGVVFEQTISVGSWTLPTHASLFTGLYPGSHGVLRSRDALPSNCPTLAERLQQAGYQTACFSNNAYVSAITGLNRGFEVVEDLWRLTKPRGVRRSWRSRLVRDLRCWFGSRVEPFIRMARTVWALGKRRRTGDKGAALTNRRIREWLQGERDPQRPFFIFVNYMECHEPYTPPPPFDRRFLPASASRRKMRLADKERLLAAQGSAWREMLEVLSALYDGGLAYLDRRIGELVEVLRQHELLDHTVFIFTSDHGDSLGEHDHIGHRLTLYEEVVRVPLIIRYPSIFEPGTRVADLVQLVDLYPTILMLADVRETMPHEAVLYTLHPLYRAPRPFAVAENRMPVRWGAELHQMVRTERYKYIWKSGGHHELYDLQADPHELHNIVEADPNVTNQMREMLEAWRQTAAEYALEGGGKACYDEAVLDHLRALGYVE